MKVRAQLHELGADLVSVRMLEVVQDRRAPPPLPSGAGLLLVEALSAQWGCCTRAGHEGKIVWAVCA